MSKPRGKIPTLICGSSGKPSKVTAQKARTCSRCSGSIVKGDECFEIPQVSGGFTNRKTFCTTCFKEVLKQTRQDLENFESISDSF